MGLQALKCPLITRYPLTEKACNQINLLSLDRTGAGSNQVNPFSTILVTDLPFIAMLYSPNVADDKLRYIFFNEIVD